MDKISVRACILAAIIIFVITAFAQQKEQGVYEFVIQKATVNFENAAVAMANEIHNSNFRLLAKLDVASPEKCSYKGLDFALYDSAYAEKLMQINRLTAPFAVVDRINLFEDEAGINVSIVNPINIGRTVFMDDEKYNNLFNQHRLALRELIIKAVPGEISDKQYGEMRKKGYIGRTMGVMAGGSFDGKIQDIAEAPAGNFPELVQKLKTEMSKAGPKWGMKLAYALDLKKDEIAILGTTGPELERKSFSIVGAGNNKSRKDYTCPGMAYAGAYPIEIVVVKDGDVIKVKMVDAMFRMKMYFEDAGKWAFAKNMGMPGSIADEIKDQINKAFKQQ